MCVGIRVHDARVPNARIRTINYGIMIIRGLELFSTLTADEKRVGQQWHDPQAGITQLVVGVAEVLRIPSAMRAVGLESFQVFGTPLLSDGHMAFFFVECALLAGVWFALHSLVLPRCWPAFRAVAPAHKKHYVVMNLLKALLLALQSFSFAWWYYSYFHYRCMANPLLSRVLTTPDALPADCDWAVHAAQGDWTKHVMSTYVSTDFISLIIVPRESMPTSTVLHHLTTVVLAVFVMSAEISSSRIMQLMMMYGFFSTLAWMVNLFLALRVVIPKSGAVSALAHIAAIVYVAVCAGNWSLQLIALAASALSLDGLAPSWGLLLWAISMLPLISDDVKLIGWLRGYDPLKEERKSRVREKVKARVMQMCATPPHQKWESLSKEARKELRGLAKAQVLKEEEALDVLVGALTRAKKSVTVMKNKER